MTVGVVGCGSIGQRHLANLRELGVRHVLATDTDPERLERARAYGSMSCADLDSLLDRAPGAVIVCTPPATHAAIGLRALRAGADVLMEKPIAVTLDDADELVRVASASGRVLRVGYNLRFHRGLERVHELVASGVIGRVLAARAEFGQYLPDWRPTMDYRTGYNAHENLGGGILLDGTHEIDYLRWILGEFGSVMAVLARNSDLDIDVEDIACLLLQRDRLVAEVHLDSVQRTYARQCKLIGTVGTLTWDYSLGIRLEGRGPTMPVIEGVIPAPNEMYIEELRSFLQRGERDDPRAATGRDGRDVLAIAVAARRSATEGRKIAI